MTPLTIYIYSNNTDLHCISAFESIKQMIPNTPIQKLQRYRKFTFSFNETTTEKAQSHLSQLLDTSYDILNPNKESYYLDQLPRIKTTTSCSVRGVTGVTPETDYHERNNAQQNKNNTTTTSCSVRGVTAATPATDYHAGNKTTQNNKIMLLMLNKPKKLKMLKF